MKPSQGILITGTDTGVGKTLVACGLAASLRRRGLRVAPFKPAETGCELDPASGTLVPADARLLRQASQTEASLDIICPYRYRTPVAPAVAAEFEGCALNIERAKEHLWECYAALVSSHDVVLIESAGGILVPLAYGFHYGDLARFLDVPVLMVAGSKLGAINHTLLTFNFLLSFGLKITGCVLNHCTAEKSPAIETNVQTLRRLLPVPVCVLPYLPDGRQSWNRDEFDQLSRLVLQGRRL